MGIINKAFELIPGTKYRLVNLYMEYQIGNMIDAVLAAKKSSGTPILHGIKHVESQGNLTEHLPQQESTPPSSPRGHHSPGGNH